MLTFRPFALCCRTIVASDWHSQGMGVRCTARVQPGTRVVTASGVKTARLWDTKTGAARSTHRRRGPVGGSAAAIGHEGRPEFRFKDVELSTRGRNFGGSVAAAPAFTGYARRSFCQGLFPVWCQKAKSYTFCQDRH